MKTQLLPIALLFILFATLLTDMRSNDASAQAVDNGSGDLIDNGSGDIVDNGSGDITDNESGDLVDRPIDNETDNETVKRLKTLFAASQDNFSCVSPRDPVKFPVGTNLERCVRENMGENRWPIDCERASKVIAITCNDDYISSLEGLQQFVNLETLIFERKGTFIDNLSAIRKLKNLKTLSLPNSYITQIGYLANMKQLRTLDLSGNMVTDLEFLPFVSGLQNLALEYQAPDYIRDISKIGALPMLTTLSLQGNKITDISALTTLKRLSRLSIRDNRISSLEPLRELTFLTALNFSINMISDISALDNLTRMNGLIGNHNDITTIAAVDNMTNLRQISFTQNSIDNVSMLANKKKLSSINLDYNNLKDLTPIKEIMYYGELVELGFAYNCVPYENYRKIRYLDTVQVLRLEHQCATYPIYFPDNFTVVNGDLVGSNNTLEQDNITIPRYQQTGGRGCSAGNAETGADFFLILTAFVALGIAIFRGKHNNKNIK